MTHPMFVSKMAAPGWGRSGLRMAGNVWPGGPSDGGSIPASRRASEERTYEKRVLDRRVSAGGGTGRRGGKGARGSEEGNDETGAHGVGSSSGIMERHWAKVDCDRGRPA